MQKNKPDLVIFFNGINDHYLGWLNEDPMCEILLQTGVRSSEVLSEAWDSRANKVLINWPEILQFLANLFSNTIKLSELILKYAELKQANHNIYEWRTLYKKDRDNHLKIVEKCLPKAEDAYIRNMQLAIQLAKSNGINIIFAHQPLLFLTKKPLVGSEISESEHPNYNFFALDDASLDALTEVPSYRIHQPYFWSRQQFLATYIRQKNRLEKIAQDQSIPFMDFDYAINQIGPIAIFSSQVHFTFRGTTVISKELAQKVESYLMQN